MLTLTIEIPALDRLCAILEGSDKSGLVAQIEDEIVRRLKKAAGDGTLEKAAEETKGTPSVAQSAPAPSEREPRTSPAADARPERPEGAEGASAAKQDAPETRGQANGAARGAIATLADIQKAAAQMRDDGKLQAVKDLFPEFGIRKLSDLKADQLQTFAERLRGMGARI